MAFKRYTLPYTSDADNEVFIQIVYFEGLDIEPDDRITEGGFDPDASTSCGGVTTRRALKPRKVTLKIDGQNNDPPKYLDIICKTKSVYQDFIDNPDSPQTGKVVGYEGEKSSICN